MANITYENYTQGLAQAGTQNGTELIPVVQSGSPVKMSLQAIVGNGRTAAEIAAGVTPVNYSYPPLAVDRYGTNTTPGTTDMRAAIKTAWNVAKQSGGGTIKFLPANYALASADPIGSINIPQQQQNGSIQYQATTMHCYFQSGSNIIFDFSGATLTSTVSNVPQGLMFDNCTDIVLKQPKIVGTEVFTGGVTSLGAITSGSGYVNGTYSQVPATGGSGAGAYLNVTVSGGAVTAVNVYYPGGTTNGGSGGYIVGDVLSVSNANLGGSGSGFSVPVTSVTGTGSLVAINGCNGIVATMVSGPSSRISIYDPDFTGLAAAVYCVGDPASLNTVAQVNVHGYMRVTSCQYGIAYHNGGDDSVIQNIYAYRTGRPFFIYGAQHVAVKATSEQQNRSIYALCKAYSRTTRAINIDYELLNTPGLDPTAPTLSFQIQGDPAVVTIPPTLDTVCVDYHETNCASAGNGIRFDYYAGLNGAVQTATSSNPLFNNFWIRGLTNNQISTTVQLGTAAQCQINYDSLIYARPAAANDLNNNNGFIVSKKFTYTPLLLFGGANSGMTFAAGGQAGEYYIAGGMCTVLTKHVLTAKGVSTGAAQIALPFPTRADSALTPVGTGFFNAAGASLTGALVNFITASGSALNLGQQGAAAIASLTDANFTNTSDLRTQISYPL